MDRALVSKKFSWSTVMAYDSSVKIIKPIWDAPTPTVDSQCPCQKKKRNFACLKDFSLHFHDNKIIKLGLANDLAQDIDYELD